MTDHDADRWARDLRAWAGRPTRLSPQAARARVVAELSERRRRPVWRWSRALLILLVGRRSEPIASPPTAAVAAQRTIVHQLSSGTRLYIVMRPQVPADDC